MEERLAPLPAGLPQRITSPSTVPLVYHPGFLSRKTRESLLGPSVASWSPFVRAGAGSRGPLPLFPERRAAAWLAVVLSEHAQERAFEPEEVAGA